ncbi:cytochrome P450 [Suillus clintonianus]|uniref:cytochrome P450 n=1 Tax=Suillus clintonianus TaxID=1904413 RepID=UPI001B86A7EB|nr:cytochrome P450 [Suillus clintonianus]KAG2152829.1 cytochrome P450 [Suillus clintonianus]
MSFFQSFFALIPLQLPDLRISDNTQLLLSAVACFSVIGVIARAFRPKSENNLPLPPSPPTWRLGGHFRPPSKPFLTTAGWIDEYGPVITIRSRLEKIVIVGRYKAAMDILEDQGKSTADRPPKIAAEMTSGGLSIAFAPFGDRYRRMRRALHSHLSPTAAGAYEPLQKSHVKNLILGILDEPHNFQNHVVTYAATTILKVAYGKNTPTLATDPEVIEIRKVFGMVAEALRPGAYLVDSIPWLRYLPWYGRDLKMRFQRSKKLNTGHLNRVKEQMKSNEDIGPSFMRYMLENSHLYGLTEIEMAFLAGAFFGAGSQTTSMAICTVLMAAGCFPEEQAKVQAELDAVIGRHRAPTFDDQKSLPRLQAFISEAMRWRPLTSGALAHRTTKDVIWENYCIPSGTTVYGDVWCISRDPDVYPEPDAFKPQRWIDDQGNLREDLKFFTFGFGRRACPGQHLASRSMYITTLLIFWAFQLTLDPTKPLEDMGFIGRLGMPVVPPCVLEFKKRIPEVELRRMMQGYAEKH